jgi:hypothetical protein
VAAKSNAKTGTSSLQKKQLIWEPMRIRLTSHSILTTALDLKKERKKLEWSGSSSVSGAYTARKLHAK